MKFNKLDQTVKGRIIPRFKLESPEAKIDIMNLIKIAATKDESIDCLQQQSRFLRLSIPEVEQHYWSPVLKLSCDDNEIKDKTIIRGHIGPNESVWGIFFLTYAAIGIIGFFGTVWAYAQWFFDKNPYYFIITPISLLILSTMFVTSKYGQKKAHTQMLHLMRFLRKSIDSIECIRVL